MLAVCGEGLVLAVFGEDPRVSRAVRARSGLGLDVYIILFISTSNFFGCWKAAII